MVTILKFLVSRRFTSMVQLSAEIMQQRSYEVRRNFCFARCFWWLFAVENKEDSRNGGLLATLLELRLIFLVLLHVVSLSRML